MMKMPIMTNMVISNGKLFEMEIINQFFRFLYGLGIIVVVISLILFIVFKFSEYLDKDDRLEKKDSRRGSNKKV